MMITMVPPDLLDGVWKHARPLLQRAIAAGPGDYQLRSIRSMLERGTMLLWVLFEKEELPKIRAAIVTKVVDYPDVREVFITHMAGKGLNEIIETARPVLEDYASVMRASRIAMQGRKQWRGVAKRIGAREVARVYHLDVGRQE